MFLSVKDIHKSYGKEKVLNGISFTIEEPEIVALVGPNGTGKTTLMNIITNLLSADQGKVTVLNKSNKDPNIFKEIAFMQDNSVLYDYLTGYDHLQFIADVQKLSKDQILKTAERVGSDGYLNKKVRTYSLGMKQHLLLTMAILNDPKLLILDEPLNGLDPTSAIRVRNLLLELAEKGTAILLSSHNLAEIDRVTSKILFLKDGYLIKEDVSEYEKLCYELTVSNVAQTNDVLSKASFETKIVDEKIRVFIQDQSVSEILKILKKHEIIVQDVDKKVFGSEERYQEIFMNQSIS